MDILFRFDAPPNLVRRVARLSEGLAVTICPESEDSAYLKQLARAEVIWHVLRPITAEHIAMAPRLRLIQKIGVGVNTIDLEAAKVRGIAVCNMPGANSRAVAEMTLALMLGALRRLAAFDRWTRAGQGWSWPVATQDGLGEIAGRTVGLVGYGGVPVILAPILDAMGAKVLFTSRSPRTGAVGSWRELDEVLAESDIVSVHVPLTADTQTLLDRRRIALMKPGAILVNTARGGLVDELALIEALRSGHIAAAGLDVFASEPVEPSNPLLRLDNVILAPHIAWLTPETLDRSLSVAVENCRRLADGRELLNRIAP